MRTKHKIMDKFWGGIVGTLSKTREMLSINDNNNKQSEMSFFSGIRHNIDKDDCQYFFAINRFFDLLGTKFYITEKIKDIDSPIFDPDCAIRFLSDTGLKIETISINKTAKSLSIVTSKRELGVVCGIEFYDTYGFVHVGSSEFTRTKNEAIKLVEDIKKAFGAPIPDEEQVSVEFTYWNGTYKGSTSRSLGCPKWEKIRDNYTKDVQEDLDDILGLQNPLSRGKLIFWYGIPGSGKTYAIRALMQKWKSMCHFVVVTDPEVFFSNQAYAQTVLVEGEFEDDDDQSDNTPNSPDQKVILLIMEDCPELVITEARSRTSFSMARLLNLTDGILGQGLKMMILITTNEKIDSIDPAFLRPGRCLQNLEFSGLKKDEIKAWMMSRGIDEHDCDTGVLASLYAKVAGNRNYAAESSMNDTPAGFALPKQKK